MEQLTRKELEQIVIAITLWNKGKLEFDREFLKLTDAFKPEVSYHEDIIIKVEKMKEQ